MGFGFAGFIRRVRDTRFGGFIRRVRDTRFGGFIRRVRDTRFGGFIRRVRDTRFGGISIIGNTICVPYVALYKLQLPTSNFQLRTSDSELSLFLPPRRTPFHSHVSSLKSHVYICLMSLISAKNLVKSYGNLQVLRGINLEIKKSEIVSIVGASGAGKTTLLTLLGTLDRASGGHLEIDGENMAALSGRAIAAFRNKRIGFVFQFHHLLPEFTAVENVCMPAFIARMPKARAETRAKELLERLGLRDRMTHKPAQLSGGEQQRVAVARALMNNPAVVFADEPSGNLDSATSKSLHELFFDLRKEMGQTFVIVTHNEELASMADRKLTIKDGLVA
jgi:lipoprotein-releasing system ATP-binding protein